MEGVRSLLLRQTGQRQRPSSCSSDRKAIGGVMSALQRQFDRLTKSQEQIGLEKLQKAGASQEVVAKYQEQWSVINRLMEAEKAAELQRVAAEAAERSRIERIKQAQIAAGSSPWIGDCKLSVL
jgi:enhancing lycopene biosynthesis protein 2